MSFGDGLRIQILRSQDQVMVKVDGELDLATVPDLEQQCTSLAEGGGLIFDLAGIRFIDVQGLKSLLSFGEDSRPVPLASPSRLVRRMIELTGTKESFEILESLELTASFESLQIGECFAF